MREPDALDELLATHGGQAAPATIAEAKTLAAGMISRLSVPEAKAGLGDYQNFQLSLGLPGARATLRMMVEVAGLAGPARVEALAAIDGISPVTDIGCTKMDFFNVTAGAPDAAFITLAECDRDHDLSAQLDKIRPHVAAGRWPDVLRHLSSLLHAGRAVYSQLAFANVGLVRSIFSRDPADPCLDLLGYTVDGRNSTLFVKSAWPRRVGLFVHLASDLGVDPKAPA